MTWAPPLVIDSSEQVKALRKSLKLNQGEFWARVGVTQSGGSRYETGRDIPSSTLMLLQIVYGNSQDSEALVKYLRDR